MLWLNFGLTMSYIWQDEQALIILLSYILLITAVVLFIALLFIDAPYGRYSGIAWGPGVSARLAWFIQELPAFCIPGYLYLYTPSRITDTANFILLMMYLGHYLQRSAFVYIGDF